MDITTQMRMHPIEVILRLDNNNKNKMNFTSGNVCYLERKMCTYLQRNQEDTRRIDRESGTTVTNQRENFD